MEEVQAGLHGVQSRSSIWDRDIFGSVIFFFEFDAP